MEALIFPAELQTQPEARILSLLALNIIHLTCNMKLLSQGSMRVISQMISEVTMVLNTLKTIKMTIFCGNNNLLVTSPTDSINFKAPRLLEILTLI